MLITDLPLWEDCPLLGRVPPEVEVRRGRFDSADDVVLWDRARRMNASIPAAKFDQERLDAALAILGKKPMLMPSEIDAERLAASNAAVADVKRQIEGERAARDRLAVLGSAIRCGKGSADEISGFVLEFRIGESYLASVRTVFLPIPQDGESPTDLASALRVAAAQIDAAMNDLANKEPNAQGK